MLFGAAQMTDFIQALQAVALAGIAAWVAVRTRQLETVATRADERAEAERQRCDRLERRVKTLEAKKKPAKPRPRKK